MIRIYYNDTRHSDTITRHSSYKLLQIIFRYDFVGYQTIDIVTITKVYYSRKIYKNINQEKVYVNYNTRVTRFIGM